jgi:transposase
MDNLFTEVFTIQASANTKYHAIHAFVFLGFSVRLIGKMLCKSPQTICNWVKKYEKQGNLKRLSPANNKKFNAKHRLWIKNFVDNDPLSLLNEIKGAFVTEFEMDISISTIYKILIQDWGYTKKKIERRAIQIRFDDICRYTKEINMLQPVHNRLVFVDEMSLDNRDMLRKRDWFLRGSHPVYIGEFNRRKRISILAFIGNEGLIEVFETDNTFNRAKFFQSIRELVRAQKIKMGSMFIMDGAKIHLDQNIVNYLRSVGLYVLFLPAYCPFFNPIEIMFSRVKSRLQSIYIENTKNEFIALTNTLASFENVDMTPTFYSCGYCTNGVFDPSIAYNHNEVLSNCENIDILDALEQETNDE